MASWRQLTASDIPALARVARVVHAQLPERDAVFAERVRLFPEGCLALVVADADDDDDDDGSLGGYAISHPIRRREPPALDSLLGGVAPGADQYYIHDVCVLPELRGRGLAARGVARLLAVAERYPSACLVSVYDTAPFWNRYGFVAPPSVDEVLLTKVRGYGADATYMERLKAS